MNKEVMKSIILDTPTLTCVTAFKLCDTILPFLDFTVRIMLKTVPVMERTIVAATKTKIAPRINSLGVFEVV